MPIPLPPWLRPAEPAQYEAEGLRIGTEQAGQAAASARADQELALRQQQLEMQATAAANKFQAQQQYQQAIQSGVDPIQAILKFGPMMGQGTDVAAAIRAQQMQAKQRQPLVPSPVKALPVMDENGKPIPNMISIPNATGTGMQVRNLPGSDIPGYVSPADKLKASNEQAQIRRQTAYWTKQKAILQKAYDDPSIVKLELRNRLGRAPTDQEAKAAIEALENQLEAIDERLSNLAGGNLEPADASDEDAGPSPAPKKASGIKNIRLVDPGQSVQPPRTNSPVVMPPASVDLGFVG